jgi:NarL family two-component system response regulator LiaR
LKLLIVDDCEEMRGEIRSIVADIASEVYECTSGSDALAMYPVHRPDWVLMDIVMEPIDGLEATRLLISSFPEAKIVIVTSYDDDYLREATRAAGARDYVLKENLFDIRRVLSGDAPDTGGQDKG